MSIPLEKAVLELTTDNSGLKTGAADAKATFSDLSDAAKKNAQTIEESYAAIGKSITKLFASTQPAMRGAQNEIQGVEASVGGLQRSLGVAASGISAVTGDISGSFTRMVASFTVAGLLERGASSMAGFASEALSAAGATVELADKTGLSTETIQRMQFVAKQTGTDVEAFATAAFKLGVNISKGTGEARKAAEDLGLSWQTLRSQSPDEQFEAVVEALKAMVDPQQRNADAVALFGKGAQTILPAVARGYKDIADKATVAADEEIRALKDANDEWDAFVARRKKDVIDLLGGYLSLQNAIKKIGQDEADFIFSRLPAGSQPEDLDAAILKAARAKQDVNLPAQKAPLDANYVQQLKDAKAAYDALTPSMRTQIAAGIDLHKSDDDLVNELGISLPVLQLAKQGHEEAAAAARKHQEALDQVTKAWQTLVGSETPLSGLQQAQVRYFLALKVNASDIAKALGVAEAPIEKYKQQLDQLTKALEAIGKQVDALPGVGQNVVPGGQLHIANRTGTGKDEDGVVDLAGTLAMPPVDVLAIPTQQDAIAAMTFNDIEGRMKALGVETRDVMVGMAKTTAAQYKDMAASGKFTAAELQSAWERMVKANIAAGTGFVLSVEDGLMKIGAGMLNAFASGGSVGQAAKSGAVALGANVGEDMAAGTVEKLADSSPLLSHALGSLAGPLGAAAVTLGIDLGKKLWASLFGDAGRTAVNSFVSQNFGTFDALQKKLNDESGALKLAGYDSQQLWIMLTQGVGRNNPQQAQAAIDKITKALADADTASSTFNSSVNPLLTNLKNLGGALPPQLIEELQKSGLLTADNTSLVAALGATAGPTYDQLTELQSRYNLSAEQMGPAFEQAADNHGWQQIIDDLQTAKDGGLDLNGVLAGMSPTISKLVEDSKKFHTTIPANMESTVESLEAQGRLLDDNGNKITDLSDVDFSGDPIEDSMKKLIDSIQKLVDALTGPKNSVASSLDQIGQTKVAPQVDVDVNFRGVKTGDWPSDGATLESAMPMAKGGLFKFTKPTLILAGEAGTEYGAFSGANRLFPPNAYASGGTSGGTGAGDTPSSAGDTYNISVEIHGPVDSVERGRQVAADLASAIRRGGKSSSIVIGALKEKL